MPTNDERRDVAAKLRDMAASTNPTWPALMGLLECPGRSVAVMYLADLIDPDAAGRGVEPAGEER